jgi:hypothetical protein
MLFRSATRCPSAMAMTPAISDWAAVPRDDAGDEVYLWRRKQFQELGFGPQEAAELAVSDADLGQARYLLGSGCASELALRILR